MGLGESGRARESRDPAGERAEGLRAAQTGARMVEAMSRKTRPFINSELVGGLRNQGRCRGRALRTGTRGTNRTHKKQGLGQKEERHSLKQH